MARETGLEQAIEAAGGVGALARALGMAQPSVSTWRRVPAERVLAVEAVTGVSRTILRPDLYPSRDQDPALDDEHEALDEIDAARAQEYQLLALLLMKAPTAEVLSAIAGLKGDSSPLGMAHIALAEAARTATVDAVQREHFSLFIGVGRGELMPYASFYLTGFLHERPLARVREDLAALGIEREAGIPEPEDHLGLLCDTMAGLISGQFGAEPAHAQRIFERHLKPWAARCFADLEQAESAQFYRAVGTVGRLFIDIETEAYTLDA